MALDGLEAAVEASVAPTERARRKFKVNVNRYADDFVVTGASKEILENNVLPVIKRFMRCLLKAKFQCDKTQMRQRHLERKTCDKS